MKIWVVIECYDSVDSVWSTREKAEERLNQLCRSVGLKAGYEPRDIGNGIMDLPLDALEERV